MSTPKDLRYSEEHEWVKEEGGNYRIGITHFAQSELGDIVFVELPSCWRRHQSGRAFRKR